MYEKVLIAVDGSEYAYRSVDHAIALVKGAEKGHIDIIYVVDEAELKSDVFHYGHSERSQHKRKERITPIEDKLQEHFLDYDVHITHGEPGPTIVTFANNGGYDCVVLGSRGLNQLQTMVLGSVSHKVAKRVACPVMIVK